MQDQPRTHAVTRDPVICPTWASHLLLADFSTWWPYVTILFLSLFDTSVGLTHADFQSSRRHVFRVLLLRQARLLLSAWQSSQPQAVAALLQPRLGPQRRRQAMTTAQHRARCTSRTWRLQQPTNLSRSTSTRCESLGWLGGWAGFRGGDGGSDACFDG